VLVKRFLFKDSLDEAVAALHARIKAGSIDLSGGRFPHDALELFRAHGVAQPHERDESAPQTEADRRYRSCDVQNQLKLFGSSGHDYGKKVSTQPCKHCKAPVEVPGTSVWWGKGRWQPLNGATEDQPALVKKAAGLS